MSLLADGEDDPDTVKIPAQRRREKARQALPPELPPAKLARWLIDASKLLQPLVNLRNDTFFSHDIAHSDDTGIQVLKGDGRAAVSQIALWIRRGVAQVQRSATQTTTSSSTPERRQARMA